ncbi:inhibitor of apoptosis-promoting Bax1-domain-containing protein [Zopfochytrium polystomum]|nr:inhibitor of apoptosis-promoting Bax1-domain-containing protein [Zopfochytrium polystomum]
MSPTRFPAGTNDGGGAPYQHQQQQQPQRPQPPAPPPYSPAPSNPPRVLPSNQSPRAAVFSPDLQTRAVNTAAGLPLPATLAPASNVEHSRSRKRLAYVRKVHSILAAQMVVTVVVSALFYFHPVMNAWLAQRPWAFYGTIIASIVVLMAVYFLRRRKPWNYILLFTFTLCESFLIGTACGLYNSQAILHATIIALVLFASLTLFTFQSRFRFEGLAPFLFGAMMVVFVGLLFGALFRYSRAWILPVLVVAGVVFSGFVVLDTYNILRRLNEDEYIAGSLQLYLDIVMIFVVFLQLIGCGRGGRR